MFRSVLTLPAFRACRLRQDPDLFVVADGLHLALGSGGDLANGKLRLVLHFGVHSSTLNLKLL